MRYLIILLLVLSCSLGWAEWVKCPVCSNEYKKGKDERFHGKNKWCDTKKATKYNFIPKNQRRVEYTEEGATLYLSNIALDPSLRFSCANEITFTFEGGQITMTELLKLFRSINPEICDRIWKKLQETKPLKSE